MISSIQLPKKAQALFFVALSSMMIVAQTPEAVAENDISDSIQSLFINNRDIGPVLSQKQRKLIAGDLERLSKIKGDGATPEFRRIFGPGNRLAASVGKMQLRPSVNNSSKPA